MGIAEKYANARSSGDLTVTSEQCDADFLIASGSAGLENSFGHLVYRAVYAKDRSDIYALRERLMVEALGVEQRVSKLGRDLSNAEARCVVEALLSWYIEPKCPYCNGVGVVTGKMDMFAKPVECAPCHGSGRTPMASVIHRQYHPLATHLVDMMDEGALKIHSAMAKKLNDDLKGMLP